MMPYAFSSFSRNTWTNANYPQTCKLLLLRDSLQGLKFLHASGFMHRDIRPQNMLILSYEPPQASVCDYGKVVEAVHSTDTCIGPIHSLAPEVWTANKDSPYDAKIDMWAFDYAIAELLGYSLSLQHPHGIDRKITHDRHTAILKGFVLIVMIHVKTRLSSIWFSSY